MIFETEKADKLTVPDSINTNAAFLADVLQGLSSSPKKLDSKYFYDATGDSLFQQIMASAEYYVTRCEAEIFTTHAAEIAGALNQDYDAFDLIELGAGDASKTIYLLQELIGINRNFRYVPVDISGSIIDYLEKELPLKLPGLVVEGLKGEYLAMLQKANSISKRKKVVLFLGSNIGNMDTAQALDFLKEIRKNLNEGDRMLIGFDLKKDPLTVLAAYNDKAGYTSAFNLNLLHRINRELGANFILNQFEHYPTYDPISGACKSYLVSKAAQQVCIAGKIIKFGLGEVIDMELSQKYDSQEIKLLAQQSGFQAKKMYTDQQHWFVDTIWECV